MEKTRMWIDYPSSITNVIEANKSFDSCVLRVCYTGENRNKTSISKEAIENAIPTIYYCPIVCHYDIHDDTIGGHDVEIVKNGSSLRLVNITDGIGVIPYGAKYWWEDFDDGSAVRNYFCIEGLLWKRSAVYEKLKTDGITSESMEITVNKGKNVDGIYQIDDFDFTAFCLLGEGVEPCFENASLETFSLSAYKDSISKMIEDYKTEYSKVIPASADDINDTSLKGGKYSLKFEELLAKYGLSAEDITFDTAQMNEEELEKAFAQIKQAKFEEEPDDDPDNTETPDPTSDPATTGTPDSGAEGQGDSSGGASESGDSEPETTADDSDDEGAPLVKGKKTYSLTNQQLQEELHRALAAKTFYNEDWGETTCLYWYIDSDAEAGEVYAENRKDHRLYGFKYTVNGDAVEIDFASAQRKKIQFVDFAEGMAEADSSFFAAAETFAKGKCNELASEVQELRAFKLKADQDKFEADCEQVFAQFTDLAENEAFDALRNDHSQYSVEQIEEKCYAIRGKMTTAKFSLNNGNKPIRLPIEVGGKQDADEPYHGVFQRYGIGAR